MDGADAIGEAVTGGMAAREVEPRAGAVHPGSHGSGACLNCGTGLIGDYCHRCGQAGHVHRTLSAFWHDIAHSVLHFEGKALRTLPMLALRPGELTRRYIAGERARFVSPMALFLFSVFLMFAVVSAIGGPVSVTGWEGARADARADFIEERAESLAELKQREGDLAQARAAGADATGIEREIASLRSEMNVQEQAFQTALAMSGASAEGDGQSSSIDEWDDFRVIGFDTGVAAIDQAIVKANANPSLQLYKLQSNAYKFSWALIPLSVPFLWLLFLHRRRYRAYRADDHVVFVTSSITFMSLGFVALSILARFGVGDGWIWSATAFLPAIHIYKQLRGAYRLSRFSALWRTTALLVSAGIATGLFASLLAVLGVFA